MCADARCPYYPTKSRNDRLSIECQRGYIIKFKVFQDMESKRVHIVRFCNCKYTLCKKYVELERSW